MGEKFIKHFTIIGGGTLISMIIGFLTTPILTRIVSPKAYGQVSIFVLYTDMSVLLLYFGLDQALVRYFYNEETDDYRRCILFKCIKIPVIATLAASAISILLQKTGVFDFELGTGLLYALCLYVFLTVIYRFAQLMVRLQYKTKTYSGLNVLQKTIYVSVSLILIYSGYIKGSTSLVIGYIVAITACVVIAIAREKKLWNFTLIKQKGECSVSSKELLKYAYPYIFTMGISTLFQAIDKISLNIHCAYEDVGVYSSAMTLIHIFAIIQTSFNTLWTPMAVEKYTQDPSDRTFYKKGNAAITVIMFLLGICLIFAKDVFSLILGKDYREAAYIIPFLIFNPVMFTISETTVTGLVLMKKSKLQVLVMIIPCLTNVIGNSWLVPLLGCRGAAISTGISYIVLFTTRTIVANRYFYVDFGLRKFYILTIATTIYAGVSTFIPFGAASLIGFLVCFSVLVLLYYGEFIYMFQYGLDLINMNRKTRKK